VPACCVAGTTLDSGLAGAGVIPVLFEYRNTVVDRSTSRCARKYQTPLLCFVFAIAADPKLLLTRVEAKQRGSVLQRIAQEWGPRHTVNKQLSASSNFIGRSETEGEGFWGVVCRSHIAEIVLNLPCSPRAASCLASGGICKCISNAAPQYDRQATRIKEGGKLDKHSCAK